MLARDLGGCCGFFYLVNGSPDIDTCRGLAADLTTGACPTRKSASMPGMITAACERV